MATEAADRFRHRYATAFSRYLGDRGEHHLAAAYELGRDAVAEEVSLLDLSRIHHDALVRAVEASDVPAGCVAAAGEFLTEALAAFEMTQRGYAEIHRGRPPAS